MKKLIILIAMIPLFMAGAARAEEQMAYVIKVTPTLAYLDVGEAVGAMVGANYTILREDGDDLVMVGKVQLVRVDDHFSIGEIVEMAEGETIEVLYRAMALWKWEGMDAMGSMSKQGVAGSRSMVGRRSFHLLAGADWGGNAQLTYDPFSTILTDAKSGNAWSLGLRLGQAVAEQWRFNLTYRIGKGKDVTQLAIEADVHLAPRGYDQAGFYFGAGVGVQQLSWDPPGNNTGSANKSGFNLTLGVQVPEMMNLVFEIGYQKVIKFDDMIDLSNVRTYLGFGRSF
ncbi:MAG TPA: hypothetical protein EYG11_20985 [Candidatus Latescibacteria bacterium]|nr:hypothetical protein [Candidatus Handelsmanbacteria bacterium]HIL11179.1 hypothetical protein [Candidatus Latescibacterota bacterium]